MAPGDATTPRHPETPRHTAAARDVSVVVPAHDAAGTIEAALVSALAQIPPPLEVIVVDDGSTDGTAEVVASVASAHPEATIRLVHQACAGPSGARNRGIELARGTWVALLDADDVWLPHKWTHQQRALERHPNAVLVASDWVRVALDGPSTPGAEALAGDPPVSLVTTRDLLLLNRFQTSTVVARTDVLRRVGGFDGSLDGVEDWDLWRRLSLEGPILKVDEPLVAYTDRPDSYSKDLLRVHRTGAIMLGRALADRPRREQRTVLAWHHLRFAVAFTLARDRANARHCMARLWLDGLGSAVPAAVVHHLAPFLAGRLRRRLRSRHPGAARA